MASLAGLDRYLIPWNPILFLILCPVTFPSELLWFGAGGGLSQPSVSFLSGTAESQERDCIAESVLLVPTHMQVTHFTARCHRDSSFLSVTSAAAGAGGTSHGAKCALPPGSPGKGEQPRPQVNQARGWASPAGLDLVEVAERTKTLLVQKVLSCRSFGFNINPLS